MPKRRSSTRLPRRTATPTTPADVRPVLPPPPRVIHAPAIVPGHIVRGVRAGDTMDYVEEWNGRHWLPSELGMHEILSAPLATPDDLRQSGIPDTDWYVTDPGATRPTSVSILRDELMRSSKERGDAAR